jgi:hypothetical protein
MQKQTITKDDGRYLIFYRFDDETEGDKTYSDAPPAAPLTVQQHVASENVAEDDAPSQAPQED